MGLIQLRSRRVEQQNDFIQWMKSFSVSVMNCLERFQIQKLKTCLPRELSEHSHYKRFITSFNELYLKESRHHLKEDSLGGRTTKHPTVENNSKRRAWQNVIQICFKSTPEMIQPASVSFTPSSSKNVVTNSSHLQVCPKLNSL